MYQNLTVVGNVGRDSEMRFTPSAQAVTSFSVAANRQYKNAAGEQVKETVWFRVTTWGKTAEACGKFVKKGMLVLVEGRLVPDKATGNPRIWTDKDGQDHTSYEVEANTVRFLSRSNDEQQPELPVDAGDPF